MLDSFLFSIAVGTVLGILAGLGVGGGSLLMIWLTMVLGMGQNTARSMNLLFFIPSAVIASIFRLRQKSLPIKSIFPALLSGPVGAAAASWIGLQLDTALLRKGFGLLLLCTGLRELLYRPNH